jgi:hypothetical protein
VSGIASLTMPTLLGPTFANGRSSAYAYPGSGSVAAFVSSAPFFPSGMTQSLANFTAAFPDRPVTVTVTLVALPS